MVHRRRNRRRPAAHARHRRAPPPVPARHRARERVPRSRRRPAAAALDLRRRAAGALRRADARGRRAAARRDRCPQQCRRAGAGRVYRAALLRLGDRRLAAGRRRRRHADQRLGAERRRLCLFSRRGHGGGNVAARWLLDMLRLPADGSVGFVTGATMANFVCLAAARRRGARAGGLGRRGRRPARRAADTGVRRRRRARRPCSSALRYLGLRQPRGAHPGRCPGPHGCPRRSRRPPLERVGAGHRHRPGRPDQHRRSSTRSRRPGADCRRHGAWLHVDGAFGLWARDRSGAGRAHRRTRGGRAPGRSTGTNGCSCRTTAASRS